MSPELSLLQNLLDDLIVYRSIEFIFQSGLGGCVKRALVSGPVISHGLALAARLGDLEHNTKDDN